MKRALLILTLLIALLVSVGLFILYRLPAPKAATLVPDTTLLFLESPNFPQTRQAFNRTQLAALCREPEIRAFLDPVLRAVHNQLGIPMTDNPTNASLRASLLDSPQGETFIALTHLGDGTNFLTGIVFGADVKQKLLETKAALAWHQYRLAKWNPQARYETKKYRGIRYHVWHLAPTVTICHAFFRSLVVFTFNEELLRDTITRGAGKEPSLASSEHYRDFLRQAPRQRHLIAFLNTERAAILRQYLPPIFTRLHHLDALGDSLTFTGTNIQDITVSYYNVPLPPSPPITQTTLALTTTSTSFYVIHSVDFNRLHRDFIDTLAAPSATALEKAYRDENIQISPQLLDHLGPEAALLGLWRDSARTPDFAIAVENRQGSQLLPALDRAFNAWKSHAFGSDEKTLWDESVEDGVRLRILRGQSSVLVPTYFVTDRLLVIASSPDYARELLDRLKSNQPTLAAAPDFQRARHTSPAHATTFAYCDARSLVPPLYAAWRSQIPPPVPGIESLTPHLGLFTSSTVMEGSREISTTVSAWGRVPTLSLLGACLYGWAQPYVLQFAGTNAPPVRTN